MRENDNIVELNTETMSENELKAYLSMKDEDTPDLWERIETGYEEELKAVKVTDINSKKRNRKIISLLAACVIITLIALPVLKGGSKKKSDRSKELKSDEMYEDNAIYAIDAGADEAADESLSDYEYAQNEEDVSVTGDASINSDAEQYETTEGGGNINVQQSMDESQKYIMLDNALYEYSGETIKELPEGFIFSGKVADVTDELPEENLQGKNVKEGQKIFQNPDTPDILYLQGTGTVFEKFTR